MRTKRMTQLIISKEINRAAKRISQQFQAQFAFEALNGNVDTCWECTGSGLMAGGEPCKVCSGTGALKCSPSIFDGIHPNPDSKITSVPLNFKIEDWVGQSNVNGCSLEPSFIIGMVFPIEPERLIFPPTDQT